MRAVATVALRELSSFLHIQQLDLLVGPKQPQAASTWDKDELTSQLSDLCDSLLAEGFRWQDVQEVLQVMRKCMFNTRKHYTCMMASPDVQAVPMEQMSEATVLDWLCLHVDPAHLPRRSADDVTLQMSVCLQVHPNLTFLGHYVNVLCCAASCQGGVECMHWFTNTITVQKCKEDLSLQSS